MATVSRARQFEASTVVSTNGEEREKSHSDGRTGNATRMSGKSAPPGSWARVQEHFSFSPRKKNETLAAQPQHALRHNLGGFWAHGLFAQRVVVNGFLQQMDDGMDLNKTRGAQRQMLVRILVHIFANNVEERDDAVARSAGGAFESSVLK